MGACSKILNPLVKKPILIGLSLVFYSRDMGGAEWLIENPRSEGFGALKPRISRSGKVGANKKISLYC
jgi:hypothetical protein